MADREPPVSEEELHAYVDGATAGGECVVIEKWLASHPEDAARVAAWRAQADAIRTRYGAVAGEPVPPRFDLDRLTRADRKWSRLAAAAQLLSLAVRGFTGSVRRAASGGDAPP